MPKKLLKMFRERNGDPARLTLWEAIGAWCEHQHSEEAMVAVENAAREFGRRRSVACKTEHHGACAGKEAALCECRCHYTRRISRFRPLRGQGEEARAARLLRGLCPTHGTALVPEKVVFRNGKPVTALLRCSRADCKYTVEADKLEGV